jgi:GMP synthase-like glutamine amidotransferase
MRIHVVQHVTFEGAGLIGEWAEERGHDVTSQLALTEEYPDPLALDLLCVMGGPMDADDAVASPWLHAEKRFVVECIAAGRLVIGTCLGAQILAEVLGGAVKRNPLPEVGWWPVRKTEAAGFEPLVAGWPDELVVGQWHGDTFDLPAGLESLYSSDAAANQAFVFDGRVVGLQFHIEWTPEGLAAILAECPEDCASGGLYVMSAEQMNALAPEHIAANRKLTMDLLDALALHGAGLAGDLTL